MAKVADAERALVKSGELAVPRGWLARAEREALGRAAGAGVETKGPGARSRSL